MISDAIVNIFHVCNLRNVICMADFKTSPTNTVIDLQVGRQKMICEWNCVSGIRALTNILFRFCNAKSSPVIFLPAFHSLKAAAKREGKVGMLMECLCMHLPLQSGRAGPGCPGKTKRGGKHSSHLQTPMLPAEDTCRRQSHFWRAALQGTCAVLLQSRS